METGLDHRENSLVSSIFWHLTLRISLLIQSMPSSMVAEELQDNPSRCLSSYFLVSWSSGWGTTANPILDVLLLCKVTVFNYRALHFHLASNCSGHVRDLTLMHTLL